MSRDVTKGGGALAEAPKLSPELTRILGKRKVVPSYGSDEGVGYGGGEFRDGVWDQPEWVDQRDRDEAAKALPGYEAMLRPITQERIRDFLLMLWHATKHQADTQWEAVETVYPMMLDSHPGWCFRPERLKLAAHAFTWFPSVQELVAFMEPDRRGIIERVESLRKVSETPTSPPRNGPIGTDEAIRRFRAKQDQERQELDAIVKARYGDPFPVPIRASGESDDAFIARLKHHRKEVETAATRAMKRFNPPKAAQPVERMEMAYEAMRKAKAEKAGKAGKADKSDYQPPPGEDSIVSHGERLAGMTPDLTTEDDP
jgi:hypothetical protein